jgi:hypothetical protein
MVGHQPTNMEATPSALSQLIAVNVEHKVLICLGHGCSQAVRPSGFLEHVRKKEHPITKEGRKQAREYTRAFPCDYKHSTIQLPADGLAPQLVIPILDGFQWQ